MNVILYVLDSLRAGFLSPYGAESGISPHIQDLAEDGTVYQKAFSQSTWTRPSAASILSSTYPGVHGVNGLQDLYPEALPTLAEELRHEGFTTIGISAMGNVSPTFGFDAGFDEFLTLYDGRGPANENVTVQADKLGWKEHFDTDIVRIATGADINAQVYDALERHRDEDLFLFIWSLDTHDPYFHRNPDLAKYCEPNGEQPIWNYQLSIMESAEERERLRKLYRDMIVYADTQIGELLERLKRDGEYEETLFVLTGDHGEAFGEHGDNGHKGPPYEEEIHVPLILKPHGRTLDKRQSDPVETVDVYPTVLGHLNVTPNSDVVQGTDLTKEDSKCRVYVETLSETSTGYRCVRTDEMKLITKTTPELRICPEKESLRRLRSYVGSMFKSDELYDLAEDPSEQYNVITEKDSTTLYSALCSFMAENQTVSTRIETDTLNRIDRATREQLKGMGYLE